MESVFSNLSDAIASQAARREVGPLSGKGLQGPGPYRITSICSTNKGLGFTPINQGKISFRAWNCKAGVLLLGNHAWVFQLDPNGWCLSVQDLLKCSKRTQSLDRELGQRRRNTPLNCQTARTVMENKESFQHGSHRFISQHVPTSSSGYEGAS